jgi:hypothetical protein
LEVVARSKNPGDPRPLLCSKEDDDDEEEA